MGIKHQAADVLSRLQTIGAETGLIKDDLPVAVLDTNISASTKVYLEKHQHALAQNVVDNGSLKEGSAPTNADFLQQQTTAPYIRQAAQSVSTTNSEDRADKKQTDCPSGTD